MSSQYNVEGEKEDHIAYLDSRRNSNMLEKRLRRTSCTSTAKHKARGLSLTFTSPTTTAHAINEVFSRRESVSDPFSANKSPEANRISFLAELPDAIARARKVHYRRDALLPKTKSFDRVQNTLKEDSAPTESDIKKEATLAQILKGKVAANHDDAALEHLDQAMAGPNLKDPMLAFAKRAEPFANSDAGSLIGRKAGDDIVTSDREEPFFVMEDINASPNNHITTTVHSELGSADQRGGRSTQNRVSRSTKRKTDESRYEPYMSVTKRRAISPSPGSPLVSPKVKGSIFRIEDLTL